MDLGGQFSCRAHDDGGDVVALEVLDREDLLDSRDKKGERLSASGDGLKAPY